MNSTAKEKKMSERGIHTGSECKTQQQYKDDCNVGKIVRRAIKTGISPVRQGQPMFLDLSNQMDFPVALNLVTQVQERFRLLPAKTRSKFDNDPANLLAHIDSIDSLEKAEEARELGILNDEDLNLINSKVAPESPEASNTVSQDASGKTDEVDISNLSPEQIAKVLSEHSKTE